MNVEYQTLRNGDERWVASMRRDSRCHLSLKAAAALLILAAAGQVAAQDEAPECRCRAPDGQMQNLGTVQCFDIVGRKNLVRCEMSTNTPYWKKVEGTSGCPDA